MSDGRKYYCLCEANCKFETMTKEQILAAIAQAAETGLVFDAEAAFITKVKEGNAGSSLTFWLGTEAQYNAIVANDAKEPQCVYILTDGGSPAELLQKIQEVHGRISALTAADVGAAPAGFGYGEMPVSLGTADDDTAFIEKLNTQFDLTTSKTRQVRFTKGGVAYIGTLWNAGNGYGTLTANSYTDAETGALFTKIIRNRLNGNWQPWEHENPPLKNNTEYRTTERYGAKPVYVKRINYGALAAKGTTVTIPLGTLAAETIVDFSLITKNASGNVFKHPAHSLYEGALMCSTYLSPSSNVLYIYTHADMTAHTAVLTVKYTKA